MVVGATIEQRLQIELRVATTKQAPVAIKPPANGYMKEECKCHSRGIEWRLLKYQVEIEIQKRRQRTILAPCWVETAPCQTKPWVKSRIQGGVDTLTWPAVCNLFAIYIIPSLVLLFSILGIGADGASPLPGPPPIGGPSLPLPIGMPGR